ncbi:hypothetical protein [Marinoscillum furvescens]|uniref:Uncharacterized protein n=1 Tax=Marinoscillum furvescens DSM 4134 TaxID=1122208 RepID=A0A3D9L0M0_MARFU|nr:hypothetical protein [Marinoscillum furvescens]RED95989.1 hypothetical protein C7460_11647 [Marinoscillum furvescens DSM 4134]
MAKQVVEETGNRNSDLEILDNIKKYQNVTSELISELDNGNKQAVIKKLQDHIDTLRTSSNRISEYFSISNTTSVENIKIQIALLEQETLNSYTSQIGSTDMMFDQLDIFFVPDEYLINKNEPVKGTIYMGATTSRSEKMKMFINGSDIPIISGGGRVELPYSAVTPNFEFKAKFLETRFNNELEKTIKLKSSK